MNTTEDERIATPQALNSHVLEVVRSAEQELAGLLQQRAQIMKRMGTIRQTLAGLANLFGDSILDDELLAILERGVARRRSGFTRACRLLLMESRSALRARQAGEELRRRFPELAARHKEPAASVATVFNRLVEYGEARCFRDDHGVRVWEWVAERQPPTAENAFANSNAEPAHKRARFRDELPAEA